MSNIIDKMYDDLKAKGYLSKDRDTFNKFFFAPGETGYQNRKKLYDDLHSKGYLQSSSYEDFAKRIGLHSVRLSQTASRQQNVAQQANTNAAAQAAAAKSAPTQPTKGGWRPNAEQMAGYQKFTDGVLRTVKNGDDVMNRVNRQVARATRPNQQKVNLGFNNKHSLLGGGSQVQHEGKKFDAAKGDFVDQYSTEAGNVYDNTYEADAEQYNINRNKRDADTLDMVADIERQIREQEELLEKTRKASRDVKAPDNLWDALRYTMSHADGSRLDQEDIDEEAIKANITNLQNRRSLLLHGTSIGQKVGKSIGDQLAEVNKMINANLDDYYKNHPDGGPKIHDLEYNEIWSIPSNPYLDVAKRSLEDAQEMFNEAGKSVGESGLTGFGKGVIRGFGSKLFDARTWDMGYTDLKGGLSLAEVLKKADEGKPLTVEQQKMLDAKATELACAAYFSGALGRGYKAGQVTAESIPFMLEFMLNPLSGTGRSAQAMLTRYALKRFGRKATMELGEDAAKKILYGDIRQLTKSVFDKGLSKGARRLAAKTLAGKASARIAGDITGAAGMTFTTGQGRVVADMLNRATGQVKFGVDTDGKVKYTGHDAPEESSLLTAYGKAFGSQFSENYSEFMGPYISYVGGMFANGLKKIGGKYLFDGLSSLRNRSAAAVMKLPFAPMVSDFIREATKSDWAKVIKGMQKRAHWDGTAEEYLEEVAGNMLNAILVGDNDFSTEEGRGVFNLSDNIDTFLGVGLMSGAMSVSSAAGYRTPAYRARKMVENADARGEKLMGGSLWGKFRSSFDAAQSEQDKQVILTALLQNSSLTNEARRAALQYASGKQFQQAVADGTFREMEEDAEKGNEVERACRAEYAEGQNIDNVEEMRDAKTRYNVLLREALAVEPNAEMYSDPQFYEQSNPNATPEQKAAMRAYAEAKAQYEGVADRMKTDMADQQQKANEQVERFKNQTDGLITRVRLRGSDAEFYVTSGHISLNNDGTINDAATSSNLTIVDGEGNQRFISRGDVVDVLAQNTPEETLEQLNDIIMNEAKAKADLIDGKLSFRAGDTFTILNNEGQEQKVTIAQDPSTMAMSAVIEGEQAAVPLTEDSMAKLQQMSDAYQESRFGKYRQEQQDAVANAENEATQEEATPASPTASQEEAGAPTEGRSYGYGESVSYVDGEGHTQEGVVHGKTPEGTYEVEFDNPPSGKEVVDEYTQEELDALVQPSSAEQTEEVVPEQVPEEEPAEPQGNDAADSVPPTTEELVEMARRGNELAQYQLDQQGIQWKEPAEQTKDNAVAQSPKKDVPRDKDGNIIYDQVPVATTIEDLYDGALDDEEIGNFVQSQIDAANKAVDKITKKKPKISTNKSAYLEAKKKWEGELREAERKAQYWNDVKAEVEKITTPADARGWKDELSGEAARRQYRENSGNDHEAKSASEVAAEFFSQSHVKVTPESYRKETGFGLDEQRKMVGKISKEGKTIDRLSEELALFDEEYYNGRFFGGDSMVAKDALIAHLSSADARKGVSKVQSEAEAQFVEDYEEQRERYYQERYHMSYEEYIEYSAQEMPELMRKYSNFDEQQFYNRYADEIEADLTRREQQSNNNNGTEENDSTREEQRHDRGNQVQSGQRTDDNSGSEGGEDSEGAVRTRDEGSDEQKSSSEESAVGGQREQETDIEQVEGANEVDKSSHKTDNQGNPLNADGTLKLEKVKSVDDLTDEDFSKPTRSVELPQVPENVDNALGADGKPVIIKKNIFEKNWEAHKFPFAESRSILKSALYNTDLVGQTQPTKRPLHWVAIKLDEKSPIVVLEVNENKDNVEIVGWYTLDGRNLERIKRQAEKNGGELVMLSPKDKVESLSTPQSDLSSDGKGKEKVSSKQGSVGRKNVYGKNKVADWRTSVSSAMRQYETSPHDAHVAMCDIIDGMDSNALYGLMRMVLRTITSLDNENIHDGWKVDATHDLFDILKDRGFVVTKGSKGVAIGDVVIDKHGIIYVVEGVGKSRLDCGLSDVNDKTIIDHMTISRASVKYYYRDVNGKKDSVRLQKADVVDAELMAEEKPFNAVIEMLRKKFPDASMEALTAADRLLREQALPGERQKAIEAVAKALGLKVEWRDTMEKENGTFNPKTRTITIARDSQHALANTFGHEVTHAVRNLSEADYKNLKDAVRRLYSSEKEYNEAVQTYGDMYTGLDFDALEEELIADNIGFMIGGRNDMTQELASRMNHRVLWAIHDAMNKVRNALAKVLHIDSKKNGLLEAIDSARATIRETMANAQRIAKEKGQGLSNESGSARQSLRTQDTAIRDALVERMRLSGMDVITDEAEGQRVLDMANGRDTRFEAARHKSEAARRRDEMLRAIDQAKAFISGKTEQQTRAERRERERKFREETKVLYDRVLAGNFDSVTLQLLDDFINKVTPNNYYGRPLSKRLSERTLRKVYERERTSSVDALFSRISESAVPADERTRPEAKRRIEEKKKELLKGWAIATGNWHTTVSDFTDDTKPIGSGKDSVVYHSKDGNSVIKVSKGKESARKFRPDMDNVALFNTVFPASKYEIIGYGEIDGKFVRFLRQPIVDFTDSTPLSVEERVAYMERLGFRPMNDEKTAFTNGEIVASDIQGNNIVKDRDGNIRVIDADMRFHTKEFGGKYSYPAVETDTETAPNIREQRVYYGNGANGVRFFRTANGEAYGFTVGGKIYIDPRIATSETPVHEYAHLWATALKSANAKEWQNVVGLMKGTKVWDEVKALYPELKSDDEIADEVLATYSGRRGAERLREEQRRIAKGNGNVFEKAEAISALESVKQALKRFWKGVADFLHIHYTSAEEVADRVMKDLLDGVDPRKFGDGGKSLDAYNKIRKHFIGEQGAERADHAEEVTTRIDNLNVAREMEDAKKDAKAIKMATGWERGADGKWRYEIPDLKYFSNGYAGWKKARARQPWIQELDALSDKLFEGEDLSDSEMARFDELAAKESAFKAEFLNREKPHLADWVENDELFKAYPDLKRVKMVFTDQLPTDVGGSYNEREHTIVVNTNYVGDIDSVLAHEVQHVIQRIEGFAMGGNPETIRQRIEDYVGENEEDAENTKSIIKSAFDLFGKASKLEIIYPIMINSDIEWQRQTATDAYWDALNTIDNGFRHFETEVKNDYSQFKGMSPYEIARTGYHVKETIKELKRMSDEYLKSLTDDDRYLEELVDRYKKALESDSDAVLYTKLSGEVESRNVERRMAMSAEERRASLAAETEDVSREDQIFLFGEGGSYDTAVVVAKREAPTKPSAGPREAEPKTLKGKEALAALDNIFRENAASVMPETVSSLERFKDLFRRPIRTFLGELVKVKDEVWNKILRNNRQDITGTVLPTIENADFAIRDTDGSTLYVKRFESERSGNLYNIVVVNKHGEVEDYVSSVHIKRDGNLRNKIKNGAELFLPQERNTDGTLFRNNSTPAAKVVKTDGLSQQSNEKKQSRRGTPNLYPDHIAQAIYEQSVSGFKFDLDEAWHDSLLSVKRLQEAISETRGVPIRDFENVYWHAVALSSVNAAEMEQLMNLRIQPFIEAVQDICKKHDLTQEDIEVYLNCKHGLERNEAMARKFAKTKAEEEFKAELKKAQKTATANPNDQDAADALDDVKQRMNDREEELYFENREKDYSGLTDIFDPKDKVTGDRLDLTVAELEDEAKKYVKRFEAEVGVADVTKLWDNIHELNNYSLRKSYLSGLISKSQYDSVKQMYQWYVPLRGFNEEVAGDVYTYVTRGETRTQQLLKEAKGRTSRAGDILATMMNMANSAVNQGNRNLMKQKILNLALNAKSPLLSVSSTWYQTDANGFDVPIEPPINDQMTPSEQKDAIEQWEDTMEMLAKQGKVHRMSDNLRLNLRTQKWQADEHCIRVQRGGKEYCVWVNGNPRAAQALNDRLGNQVTKPYKATETILDKAEDLFTDGFIKIFRYMAQSVTSLNPEFVISNFQRDLASASLISTGKYGAGYTKDFLVNVKRLGVLTGTMSHKKEYRNAAGIYTLYSKYKSGNLDNNNEMERYFAEFMANGGETGYTQSLSIKDYQSRIQSALGDKGFVKWSKNAGHAVADFVEMANRGVENTCRFAAYMTSRQHGKSVLQAIVDAKEASTNFNLHGAGGFGNAWLRKSIIFINPAVQSIVQYCQLTAKHPKAMLSMLGGTIGLGAAMAFACASMVAPGGGDPDSNYWDLSDYVRHNYIVIPSGNGNWTRIALPPEIRAVYGLGVIAMEAAMGRMNHSSIPAAIGDQLMQFSPVAFLDPRNFFNRSDSDHSVGKTLIKAFTPTLASPIADAYIWDEDFMGRQITGRNDFNEDKPEFQRVSYDTLPLLVSFSRWLNNISGGNDYKKGWINVNPSSAGYVASQYIGGPLQFFTKIGKTVAMITYEDLRDMRNVPFLSRFMTSTDNDYGRNQVSNAEFKYWSAIADDVRTQIRGFEKEIESGDTKNLDDYKKLVSSKEYEMYQMIDYMDWLKDIRELDQKRKEETTQDAQKQVTLEIYEVRRKMAECLNKAEEMGVYLDMSQLNLELANAKTTEERAAIQAKINEKRKENLKKIGAIE